ncbi:hypothetical protein C922_04211 [Plasmodium inui San Antonio 1]|uniref:Uncharacterized protein n=1 Tax=Plasmodium inui San Antonio 1 TaxID=1237626 RepID=W7AJF5_9APIC|nr:hypothetical protein C922_04211 [Plasmodium inui San Antonio 1]EUD65471.1 hypothetical protein C922_04211 [Plasmodium inui San Antonio 1]
MSEYQISSVYFSKKNKLLLLICVFFFSCSTHIFKNVFPFLFMLTGVHNQIDIENVAHQEGRFPEREGQAVQTDPFGQSAAFSLGNNRPVTVSRQAMNDHTFFEAKARNSHSIYLYSNILSLIYCSSLVTYIFILIFDLGKKNYVVNSFYIVNLVSHFIIFLLLSDIQMRNTDLRVVTSGVDTSMSRLSIPLVGRIPMGRYSDVERKASPNDGLAKRRDINFYFKRNLQDRLNSGEFLSVGLFQGSALQFILGGGSVGSGEEDNQNKDNKEDKDEDQNNSDRRQNGSDRDAAHTYERKYLNLLYLFIIVSSICSGYIKIYQKKIMYCIFYVNIGLITSLLILMNNLCKLFAHSLNYVVTSSNSNTDISDYIILFLVIDMFGFLMILIFTYKWFYQKKLWVNMHSIFYNYKYVCFYHKETYYLYSVDKDIDNILVHIDMCGDENIKISFCAYMNLNKSIFYDYFRLNTFRKNKLRILEIQDESLEVKSTYRVMDPPGEVDTPSGECGHRSQRSQRGTLPERSEGDQLGTPSFSRKKKHSYTMKPYKICIEPLSSLANLGPKGAQDLCEKAAPKNQLEANQLEASQFASNGMASYRLSGEKAEAEQQMDAADRDEGNVQTEKIGKIPSCVKKQRRRLAKGDSVHFLDQPEEEAAYKDQKEDLHLPHDRSITEGPHGGVEVNVAEEAKEAKEAKEAEEADRVDEANDVEGAKLSREEEVDPQEREEQKRNVLLIPNCDEECNRNVDYYDEWGVCDDRHGRDDRDNAGAFFLSRDDESNGEVKNTILNIYQGIKQFSSSFTFYFLFFIFIYAFLISIMHIFINYFFYIYLFVFNINIYVSNVYTIIMTSVSLIAIPFSGYIVDNIGSFLSLLLCSSSFILVAISGSIYCYKFNLNSEPLAFLFFNLIGISESIIPTVIISQIPTHLCVKNNENITSAFAIFELVTMIIISLNNYIFGCFLIKEEYLKGLYVLFFFVILVIILILCLFVTIYLKNKRSARAYKSPRDAELVQPLL